MKTEKVKCKNCEALVDKPLSEIKRSRKMGRPLFCNLSCSSAYRNKHISPEQRSQWDTYDIAKHAGNQLDELSPFRPYLNKGKFSNIRHGMSLTPEYLKSLWEYQRGICPYTGIKMLLPRCTSNSFKLHSLKKASLDRIDSNKGYTEGNVEFVCYGINLAKNSFTQEEMKEFLSEIGGRAGE
jgi:hypothetical protein